MLQANKGSLLALDSEAALARRLAEVETSDLVKTGKSYGSRGKHHSHPLLLRVVANHPIAQEHYILRNSEDHASLRKPNDYIRVLEVEPSSGYYG